MIDISPDIRTRFNALLVKTEEYRSNIKYLFVRKPTAISKLNI